MVALLISDFVGINVIMHLAKFHMLIRTEMLLVDVYVQLHRLPLCVKLAGLARSPVHCYFTSI